ncbi:MAG: proline dehydrogenase family protein [Elusimicrobia bacterium]|nr:proline dehydrogenase family protein [Elusimicrobiota bacterium]
MSFLAKRFVAGETKEETLARARQIHPQGLLTTIDFLGEHTPDTGAAAAVTREYGELLDLIKQDPEHPSTLSIKPTHIGLDVSEETALNNYRRLLESAKTQNNFIRIDMEGSNYTDATLKIFHELNKEYGSHVGVVIQAYLYRSVDDLTEIIMAAGRVRLCKGAYKEPPMSAFPVKEDVNQNFDRLCEMLMKDGSDPAIATHDEIRIRNALAFARKYGRGIKDFEFQMLLGIKNKLAVDLAKSGYRVRLYLPYGKEWFGYFYRRLRERKENLFFVLKNLFHS